MTDVAGKRAVSSGRSAGAAYGELGNVLEELYSVISERKENLPEGSYTTYLFESGLDKILKKVAEESGEVIIAAKNHSSDRIASETADLLYHLLVLLVERGLTLDEITAELRVRRSAAARGASKDKARSKTLK